MLDRQHLNYFLFKVLYVAVAKKKFTRHKKQPAVLGETGGCKPPVTALKPWSNSPEWLMIFSCSLDYTVILFYVLFRCRSKHKS